MATQYKLDDKYTNGLWYDQTLGAAVELQESEDGENVELLHPENGDVVATVGIRDFVVSGQQDFVRISDEAVNNPKRVVNRALRMMRRNDVNELSGYPQSEAIDLRYACSQVEIEEAD